MVVGRQFAAKKKKSTLKRKRMEIYKYILLARGQRGENSPGGVENPNINSYPGYGRKVKHGRHAPSRGSYRNPEYLILLSPLSGCAPVFSRRGEKRASRERANNIVHRPFSLN